MKKFGILRKIAVLLSVGILGIGLTGCQTSESEKSASAGTQTIRIGSSGTDGTATDAARIAQSLGYFEEELEKVGYKPEYVGFAGAGPAMNEALVSKSLDIALYGDLPAITAKNNGVDVKVFASYSSNYPFAVLVGNDSGIESVSDLKGKKVAVGFGTVPYEYFYRLLEKNGLKIEDVEIINTATDGPTMLASNQVDAVVTADTAVRIYEINGLGKTLISSKDDSDISGLLIAAATSEYLKDNRDAAVAIVKALDRAYDFAKSNPDEALEKLVTDNYTKEILALTYSDTSFSYFNPEITADVSKRIEASKNFLIENHIISNDVNIEELIDTSIYNDAKK